MLPSLYISHGSPMTALEDTPGRHFLESLGTYFPRPDAILAVSAHWETAAPMVSAPVQNSTLHDFYGFPRALYALSYDAPVASKLAVRVAELLREARMGCGVDHERGLDHGAWVPLLLAYPEAGIPVIQLSLQPHLGARHHMALGAALAPLRAENVLILGSGSFTHDLRRFRSGTAYDAPETPDVTAFSDWMDEKIMAGDFAALADYRKLAPFAVMEHPTEEHLLPLHVALGAAGPGAKAKRLHSSVEYGFMRMDAYSFS